MDRSDRFKGADVLKKLVSEIGQNTRHDIWVWLWLWLEADKSQHEKPQPNTCNSSEMGDEIAYFLKRRSYVAPEITKARSRFLIPDESLAWIDTDERTYQWLYRRLAAMTDARIPRGLVHLNGREHLIAIIDIWDIDIEVKAREVESLSEMWRRHKALDSSFDWFQDKKEGTRRCKCAWEWLEKNRKNLAIRQLPVSNFKELLMYFDKADFGLSEQKSIINEIKKRWSRKQLDERNPDKKQFNVMLPIAVIAQIDELAARHNLKRFQVIESLVVSEADIGIYLSEN